MAAPLPEPTKASRIRGWRSLLWRRHYYAAEETLTKPPLTIAGVLIGALVGVAVGVGPGNVVHEHGRLVVAATPTLNILAGAVVGSAGGIVVVWVGAFMWSWLRYWRWGDPIWKTECVAIGDTTMSFELASKDGVIPHDAKLLGQLVCLVRTPGGEIVVPPGIGYVMPRGSAQVYVELKPEPGTYEVHWIRAREGDKWHEKARGRVTLMLDEEGKLVRDDR